MQGEVDLYPPIVLKEGPVHLGEVGASADHVARGRRTKRARGGQCVDRFENGRLAGSIR